MHQKGFSSVTIIALVALLLVCGVGYAVFVKKTPEPQLQASLSAVPISGDAPLTVTFLFVPTVSGDYTLDFGDPMCDPSNGCATRIEAGVKVQHTYKKAGVVVARVFATVSALGAPCSSSDTDCQVKGDNHFFGEVTIHVNNVQETAPKTAPTTVWRRDLPSNYANGWTWYSVMNGKVYCMNIPVPDADAATFVASSEYAKDKKHAYRCVDILAGADPSSFTVVGHSYAKDAQHVYHTNYLIVGADQNTFETVGASDGYEPSYTKDSHTIYYLGRELLNADANTFANTGNWFTDRSHVYMNGNKIRSFNAATFLQSMVSALPTACQKDGFAQRSKESPAAFFSAAGDVWAYSGNNSACVVDTASGAAKYYSFQGDLSGISRDGSKIYYNKYYGKEWGMGEGASNEELAAFYAGYNAKDYGLHVIDGKTGLDTLIVHSILPGGPSSRVAVILGGYNTNIRIADIDLGAGLLIEIPDTSTKKDLLLVRRLPSAQWEYLTEDEVKNLPIVRTLQLPKYEFFDAAEVSLDGKYIDYIYRTDKETISGQRGQLNIATGENKSSL